MAGLTWNMYNERLRRKPVHSEMMSTHFQALLGKKPFLLPLDRIVAVALVEIAQSAQIERPD